MDLVVRLQRTPSYARALISYWPAVSPDAGRSFWSSDENNGGSVFPTVSPLTDEEIGQVGSLPWDGANGPRSVDLGDSKESIEFHKFEYVDYVENLYKRSSPWH